ncbi:energy-coupling factor transporter transmembrane protein EcfT ['Fragaria x ananassa' phyllody phytoplasma]|uniref:Energy-coupling factor transporter transmembrane protein EcfT n=1 Tax='Fragaria x ananassa' phyllody phytoplasma TaxID=2358428 RepID=A0ABS5K2P4_9MOLU|nr:energy-coupling factor transporter transmembrane component T ['Fragaria x ananassa' phyllody phytoplasma]MBS2126131.1 energy-coupling factor transporter transmembrane protein EcfT ['Fragaria x ananassa' phyllody phytoplasma]
MYQNRILEYRCQNNFIYQIQGATKLFFVILISIASMFVYHIWFLLGIAILSLFLLFCSQIKWYQIAKIVKGIVFFLCLNNLMILLFFHKYGAIVYHDSAPPLFWFITRAQLFYHLNLFLKYCCIIPLFLVFVLTTNPSELAASLNQWGINYKTSYALALTIRYIPGIQKDYQNMNLMQQARGLKRISKKNFIIKIINKIQKITFTIISLIFWNLEKIDIITNAMQLRRFGQNPKRTWYYYKKFSFLDLCTLFLGFILLLLSIYLLYRFKRFYYPFK